MNSNPLLAHSQSKKIDEFIKQNKSEMLAHRRWFHQHPEFSFKEYKTSAYIVSYLKELELDDIEVVAKTGVVCTIGQGEYVAACRFNMDGLPIPERTALPFCSLHSGYSHSCGHDFELAWGVMIAKYFKEYPPQNGKVRLIFQPAEEGPGEEEHGKTGGRILSELGVFDVDSVMSLHLDPEVDIDTVSIVAGEVTCSAYDFEIILQGKTCHAAKPTQGINPVDFLAKILNDINKIKTNIMKNKKSDEEFILLTVTQVSTRNDLTNSNLEETINTIPEFLILKGISRIRSNRVKIALEKGLNKILNKAFGLVNSQVMLNKVAVATINSVEITENALQAAKEHNLKVISKRTTWRDDAGWASEKAPTFHGFVGIFDGTPTALHSSTFNPNEEALINGLKMFLSVIEKNLFYHPK